MVSAVAPKLINMSSINIYPQVTKDIPIRNVKTRLLPRIFSAHFTSFAPKTMDIRDAEPTPISEPKACMMFMMGMVMARPAIAKAPTPCPIKMRSAIL